jgi:tetratricopeptide (TPR) repeat protein
MKTGSERARYSTFIFMCSLCLSAASAFAHDPTLSRDCTAYSYAPAFPTASASYRPRYATVARGFLDAERNTGPLTPTEYAILDAVIDEAKSRLKPIPDGLDDAAHKKLAVESLQTIDCTLVRHGFVYPGIGLVQLLSDGLDSTMFTDPRYYNSLLNSPHNAGRASFIAQRKPGPYYVVDCDIASYIYLAVGEIMRYPLSMVQMPLHNFIRWRLPKDRYIDFETMDGIETDDDYYAARWHIPKQFIGVPGVLTSMSPTQLLAYEDFGLAIAKTWKRDYAGAIASYEKSIAVDASLGDSENNLAWLYTVVPDAKFRDGKKAVGYAQKAVAIFANGDWLDTLACAYGLAGDLQAGIDAENRALQVGWAPQGSDIVGDLGLLKSGRTCEDPKFGIDPRPFRQGISIPLGILNKDFNAIH